MAIKLNVSEKIKTGLRDHGFTDKEIAELSDSCTKAFSSVAGKLDGMMFSSGVEAAANEAGYEANWAYLFMSLVPWKYQKVHVRKVRVPREPKAPKAPKAPKVVQEVKEVVEAAPKEGKTRKERGPRHSDVGFVWSVDELAGMNEKLVKALGLRLNPDGTKRMSVADVAKEMGVTAAYVSQLVTKAVVMIKEKRGIPTVEKVE